MAKTMCFRRRSLVVTFFVLSAVGWVSPAAAQLRVAMMEIEGPDAEGVALDLADTVRDIGHKVIKSKVYRNAAKRLRAKKLNAAHVRKVSEFLRIDAVVFGSLQPERGRYIFTIKVREGKSGRLLKSLKLKLKGKQLSKKIRRMLRERLIRTFDEVEPISGNRSESISEDDGDDEEEEVEDDGRLTRAERRALERERRQLEKERKARERRERAEKARERKRRDSEERARKRRDRLEQEQRRRAEDEDEEEVEDEDDELDEQDEEEIDEGDEEEEEDAFDDGRDRERERDRDGERDDDFEKASSPRRERPLRMLLGPSAVRRSLTFNSAGGLADDQLPQEFRGGVVPGVFVAGEIYPLAFSKGASPLKNVGIGFSFDRVLTGNAGVVDDMGTAIERPFTQMRWGVDLRYRINFGSSDTSPTLYVGAGYGQMQFSIDRGNAAAAFELPDVGYSWASGILGFRMPFGDRVAASANASGLFVLKAGDITSASNYGEATVIGVDGELLLEVWLTDRYLVALGGHTTALGFNMAGTGVLADRDGDPDTKDVGGALDLALTLFATVGVSL